MTRGLLMQRPRSNALWLDEIEKSRSSGPGLRFAPPSPRPARRLGSNNGPKGLPYRVGRACGAQGGGTDAGQAPRTVLDAFLPGSPQSSKKNPNSRVQAPPSGGPLPLTVEPLFLLAG